MVPAQPPFTDQHSAYPVRVDRVSLHRPGALILTGPSGAGKGEVAAALCRILSIDSERQLSMGGILRSTFLKANEDADYRRVLATNHDISADLDVLDCIDANEALRTKVREHLPKLRAHFGLDREDGHVSQLQWLEFCTTNGLLVPNRWTKTLITARLEELLQQGDSPLVFDGYPRTIDAAENLLELLEKLRVPVHRVLHLSIGKLEMLKRANQRGRRDDTADALASRYEFYVDQVQPSIDYLKSRLGPQRVALIDAHQPAYRLVDGAEVFDLGQSIANVVATALRALNVPQNIVLDLVRRDA